MKKGTPKGHLSYSGLGAFDSCQRHGYENYMQNVPPNEAKALRVGKLFHKCIELGCDEEAIYQYIDSLKDSKSYYTKNGAKLYEDYTKAIEAADRFYSMGLYDRLELLHGFDEEAAVEDEGLAFQEFKVEGSIGPVPFVGIIDFIEVTQDEIKIHDWKHVRDFQRRYNENDRAYEEWYECYILQQMLYAVLFFQMQSDLVKGKKITCEIVGISKQSPSAVQQIEFEFKDIHELINSTKWAVFVSKAEYIWRLINETTEDFVHELTHCGICETCRNNQVVIKEFIEVR